MVFFLLKILKFSDEYVGFKCKFEQALFGGEKVGRDSVIHDYLAIFTGHLFSVPHMIAEEVMLDDYIFHCHIYNKHLPTTESKLTTLKKKTS